MAAHTITSFEQVKWATTSHREARHGTPYRLRWADIVQPDLPAEQRLGARFRMAMIRLEELLNAIHGVRSNYDLEGDERYGYKRGHPRCLWGPEQWKSSLDMEYYWQFSSRTAFDDYYEYPCFGALAYGGGHPEVPIRSRSGDQQLQYLLAAHDTARFPRGSVWRTSGYEVGDHRATLPPTRPAGWPANNWPPTGWPLTSEYIEVYYLPPAGTGLVKDSVKLHYRIADGVTVTVSMLRDEFAEPAEPFRASVPAQLHGKLLKWFVRASFTVGEDEVVVTDPSPPAGATFPLWTDPPADEHDRGPHAVYTCLWFTHWNYYGRGLPDFSFWHYEAPTPDCPLVRWRHGTDEYLFDGSEEIQPALINMCRFVLDWLGRRFHHNPRMRGHPDACCFLMPIKFYWLGSAPAGEYVQGGKWGAVDDMLQPTEIPLHPLHNHPLEPGVLNAGARRSWRGIPMVYKDAAYYDNFMYGCNESWLPHPELLEPEVTDTENPEGMGHHFESGVNRGLREGDVIDPIHLEEIIAAVDYFVDYGVWTTVPYCSRKLTPGTFLGKVCGTDYSFYASSETSWTHDYHIYAWECCEESYQEDPTHGWCTPWPRPTTNAECNDPCLTDACYHNIHYTRACYWVQGEELFWSHTGGLDVICNGSSGQVCGQADSAVGCIVDTPATGYGQSLGEDVFGWSAWVCGPRQNKKYTIGCDDLHGNGVIKGRYDHEFPEPNNMFAGPSAGNRFGDIESCGTVADIVGGEELWFGSVTPVIFNSPAASWFEEKDCTPGPFPCNDDSYGSVDPHVETLPGLGHYRNYQGEPHDDEELCVWGRQIVQGVDWFSQACACVATLPVCRSNLAWVAIDLNLDGVGRPYTYAPEGLGGAVTDRVPKLYDYDFDPPEEYLPWVSACPCETATGADLCT